MVSDTVTGITAMRDGTMTTVTDSTTEMAPVLAMELEPVLGTVLETGRAPNPDLETVLETGRAPNPVLETATAGTQERNKSPLPASRPFLCFSVFL